MQASLCDYSPVTSSPEAALSEEEATIEDVHEPYLIQLGLLERTPRGRRVTPKAYEHLGGVKQTLL